jgi:hypothetical protein
MSRRANIVLLLALLILLALLKLVFSFNGLYGQDAFEYFRYTKELRSYWLGGSKPDTFFWPEIFPLFGSILSLIISNVSLSLQLISIFSFFGTILYIQKILNSIYPENKNISWYCILILFFAPFFTRAAFLCMSDMLAIFFTTACFAHYYFYSRSFTWWHFSLCIFFAVAAFFTRYATFLLTAAPVAAASLILFRKFSLKEILLAVTLMLFAALPHFMLSNKPAFSFVHHTWLSEWSPLNFFRSSFVTGDEGRPVYFMPNILFNFFCLFHPSIFMWGLLFIPASFKYKLQPMRLVLLISITAYLLFLSGIPSQNKRYIVAAVPFTFIFLFEGFDKVMNIQRLGKTIRLAVPAISLILMIYAFHLIHRRMQFEQKVFSYLSENTKGKSVYTFDVEVALRGYELPSEVISLWHKEIATFDKGSFALFSEKLFAEKWRGHQLIKNWERLKNNYSLKPLHNFGDGWELYEIR